MATRTAVGGAFFTFLDPARLPAIGVGFSKPTGAARGASASWTRDVERTGCVLFVLIVVSLCLGCGCSRGYDELHEYAMPDASRKVNISTVSLEKDFGIMHPGERRSEEYDVENKTDGVWTLKTISTSCGCTKAFPDSETVAPHSSTKFHVQYSAGGRTREERRVVYLRFREQNTPEVALGLIAAIREPMTVSPEDLAAVVAPNDEFRGELHVLNYGEKPWNGLKVSATAPWIGATTRAVARGKESGKVAPARQEWIVSLVISTAGLSPGDYTGYLNIEAAGHKQVAQIGLSVRGAVALIPSTLFFGEVGVGDPVRREVVVRFAKPRSPGTKLHVAPSENISKQLKLSLIDDGSQYVRLSTDLTASDAGLLKGEIRISFDGGKDHLPDVSLPLYADARPSHHDGILESGRNPSEHPVRE